MAVMAVEFGGGAWRAFKYGKSTCARAIFCSSDMYKLKEDSGRGLREEEEEEEEEAAVADVGVEVESEGAFWHSL